MAQALSGPLREAFNIALHQARLLEVELVPLVGQVALDLAVLSLPEGSTPLGERRVRILLNGVSRLAGSARDWRSDPLTSPTVLEQLSAWVLGFASATTRMLGYEFLDAGVGQGFDRWADRVNLDVPWSGQGTKHSLAVYQEDWDGYRLDLCFWFDGLEVRTPEGDGLPLEQFVEDAERFWDAWSRSDPETHWFSRER